MSSEADCCRSVAAASRRRPLLVAAVLAIVLHAALLDRFGADDAPRRATPAAALAVRTLEPPAPAPAAAAPATIDEADTLPPRRTPPRRPRLPPPQPPVAAAPVAEPPAAEPTASPPTEPVGGAEPLVAAADAPASGASAAVAAAPSASAPEVPEVTAQASAPSPDDEGTASITALDGGRPPPTYPVLLPPPLTLRYEVRRGFLRGTGEIRWEPGGGDGYALRLEARIGGLILIAQTSEGTIGTAGLAPRRFVDQRFRRSAQAANFDAEARRIRFSGPPRTYALLAGTQDRLSLFIQLAGIAAADPERLVDGAVVTMVVVGARGDAAVWNLRVAGREAVETAAGPVDAVKLVREARGPADTGAEIWLDPARHYLPVHATLRNAAGASEYDLLLEGIVSGS